MDVNKESKDIDIKEEEVEESNGADEKNKEKASRSSSKTAKLEKRIEELESEKEELNEQLLRKAAEFENYRKRTTGEFGELALRANAELITDLLPVIDDFERLLNTGQESDGVKDLYAGVELIYKNLMKVLEKRAVKPIESVGQEFDPEKHDALMQVEHDEYPSNTVVEEHVRGYVMKDRVLRHSQVLVSK